MRVYKENEIKELAIILKEDGVISVPTDTVYGLCARYDHIEAQEKLREIKHRPETKAFPIMCKNLEEIERIVYVSKRDKKLVNAFMPGPITLILKKREEVEDFVNGGMDTIAIRMATSKVLEELIDEVGVPLYMTSANQSGEKTCTTLEEIEEACVGIDGMLEGETEFGQASTIVDCSKEMYKIVRNGPITEKMIEEVLKEEVQ